MNKINCTVIALKSQIGLETQAMVFILARYDMTTDMANIGRRWYNGAQTTMACIDDEHNLKESEPCLQITTRYLIPMEQDRGWRPAHKRSCDWAHQRGVKVMLHTCGNVMELIPDLIDAVVGVHELRVGEPDPWFRHHRMQPLRLLSH